MTTIPSASPLARRLAVPLWIVVIAGCIIAMLSFGPRSVMGLFLAPMTDAREWSREVFALAIAVQNLLWGIGQPIAGAIADRWGTGRVIAGGGLIYASGLAIMAWAPDPLWLNLGAGVLMGLGMAATSFTIVLAAFGRRVPREKQSLIFGLGTAAGSLGQFLFAPLGVQLIATMGWADALLFLAALMLIIPMLALALVGRPDPAMLEAGALPGQSLWQAITEAFGHRSYLLLTAGFFVCGFQLAFITTHLPPYILDVGLDPAIGGWALALIGLFNVAGSLASGWIGQHYPKPAFLSLIYVARSAAIAIFMLVPPSTASVLVFSAAMGLLWLSTVPPTSGLVAIMFGPRYMATLMGIVFFSHQVGGFLGVWLGGRLYDETGSYDIVWWIGAALGIYAALIHWPIREAPAPRPAVA